MLPFALDEPCNGCCRGGAQTHRDSELLARNIRRGLGIPVVGRSTLSMVSAGRCSARSPPRAVVVSGTSTPQALPNAESSPNPKVRRARGQSRWRPNLAPGRTILLREALPPFMGTIPVDFLHDSLLHWLSERRDRPRRHRRPHAIRDSPMLSAVSPSTASGCFARSVCRRAISGTWTSRSGRHSVPRPDRDSIGW